MFNTSGKKLPRLKVIFWFNRLNDLVKIVNTLLSTLSAGTENLDFIIFAITSPPMKYKSEKEIAKFVLLNSVNANKNIRVSKQQ